MASDRVSIGDRFGRWTVIRHAAPKANRRACMVRCRCGAERVIQERRLTSGQSKGCRSSDCYQEAASLELAIGVLREELEGAGR